MEHLTLEETRKAADWIGWRIGSGLHADEKALLEKLYRTLRRNEAYLEDLTATIIAELEQSHTRTLLALRSRPTLSTAPVTEHGQA